MCILVPHSGGLSVLDNDGSHLHLDDRPLLRACCSWSHESQTPRGTPSKDLPDQAREDGSEGGEKWQNATQEEYHHCQLLKVFENVSSNGEV